MNCLEANVALRLERMLTAISVVGRVEAEGKERLGKGLDEALAWGQANFTQARF